MKIKRLILVLGIIVLGALVLSPAVTYFDPGPMPGDIVINSDYLHFTIPVIYSLCASTGLALLYLVLKR